MQNRISSYINQFNDVYNGDPWLDETFYKKLDRLTEEQSFTQAPGNNHSVAEVVSHLIVWRYEVLRRLKENTEEKQITDDSPENWKDLALLRKEGWSMLYEQFKQSHREVIAYLESKDDHYLDGILGNSAFNNEYFVAGLLQHDVYHLGQIGLILKWTK